MINKKTIKKMLQTSKTQNIARKFHSIACILILALYLLRKTEQARCLCLIWLFVCVTPTIYEIFREIFISCVINAIYYIYCEKSAVKYSNDIATAIIGIGIVVFVLHEIKNMNDKKAVNQIAADAASETVSPCPFCGNQVHIKAGISGHLNEMYKIKCQNCQDGIYMWDYDMHDLLGRWNTAAEYIKMNNEKGTPVSACAARKMFRSGPEGTV